MDSTAAVAGFDPSALIRAAYPAGVDYDAPVLTRSLVDVFETAAERFSRRPCLFFLGRRWSYAAVRDQVRTLSAGLAAQGIGPGRRVALLLPNSPYSVWFYFAVLTAGATVVNLNPLYSPAEIDAALADSEPDLLVTVDIKLLHDKAAAAVARRASTAPELRLVVCAFAAALPWWKGIAFRWAKRKDLATPAPDALRCAELFAAGRAARRKGWIPPAIDPLRDVAVLQYTGGTTGEPKAAMLTHAALAANAQQCVLWFVGARPGAEKMLAVLPLFHVFAMTVAMNAALEIGAEIQLLPRFDLPSLMQHIAAEKPTVFPGVPSIFAAIVGRRTAGDLTSLRYAISGGAPLAEEIKRRFEGAAGCPLVEGYGLTESSPVVAANPFDGRARAGCIGLPFPGVRLRLIDPDAPGRSLAPDERGEVLVQGPQLMAGYWRRPAETAAIFLDGWLRTGDVAQIDPDGFVRIVDRIKDLILCGGYNVYPRMVEDAALAHPEVMEAAAVGIADGLRGEWVKLYVAPQEGATLDVGSLEAHLTRSLAPHERPRRIEVRPSLPKTLIGKIDKKALRAKT